MFKRLWHYLINSFLVSTATSYKKALVLGTDHEAKLMANQADAVIAAILATFTPVLQSFKATDVNLRIALGEYKGETQTVEELFDHLNKILLPLWELQIFTLYAKGTSNATILLPQGRKPFQNGTYESRIQEIKTLGDKPLMLSSLPLLSGAILAFHTQIESARQLQQSSGEGQVKALRTLRETARVSMCQSMFGNLGLLMNHYKTNPEQVANYFDLALLRTKSKDEPEMTTARGNISNAQTGNPVVNATVKFTIEGGETITVQTDANGEFEVELGTFTETTNGTIEVTAAGYLPYNDSGSIEPGEDYDVDVDLQPIAPPPPAPPVP
jgi:hypothetical protein